MAAAKVLADFKADREQLEDAIVALEELARTKPRRRRPPAWMIEVLNPPRGSGPRPRTPAGARRYGLDVALFKNLKITENGALQLRGEAFNALNHSNLAAPNANISVPVQVGRVLSVIAGRQLQVGAKLLF